MKKTCLVLTGGGARAAYQVGVMKAIASWYPRVHHSPFNLYCGTSAGAINAISLACYTSCFRLGTKKLEWLWARLHSERVFSASGRGMIAHLGKQGLARLQGEQRHHYPFSLFDNRPLRDLLNQVVGFHRLEQQIHSGVLYGLNITASRYRDGHSVNFFQGHADIADWTSGKQEGFRSKIYTEHLLASAAIPLVFPASCLGNHYYGDGAVHQLTPLKPAIKMGADKIMIIDLVSHQPKPLDKPEAAPGLAQLGGHLLDTIFTDSMETDIGHMHHLNNIISKLSDESRQSINLRHIDSLHLSPQQSFETLAEQHYDSMPRAVRTLLMMFGISPKEDAAITSYLLFEHDYIQTLIQRGYEETMEKETQVRAFLSPST